MLRVFLKVDTKSEGSKMEVSLRGAQGFNERSDYAVALMYLGRGGEAIKLLQELEKEQPGQYFVAANLGTAFEFVREQCGGVALDQGRDSPQS